jgi:hypothetical protein
MDTTQLRDYLGHQIARLKNSNTDSGLMKLCAELELPYPTGPATKAERLADGFACVPDTGVSELAHRFIAKCQPEAHVRNVIQDILWSGEGHPDIPKQPGRTFARESLRPGIPAPRGNATHLAAALPARPSRKFRTGIPTGRRKYRTASAKIPDRPASLQRTRERYGCVPQSRG